MSYKASQLFPPMGTRSTQREVFVRTPLSPSAKSAWSTEFLRSWLKRDSKLEVSSGNRIKWNSILGLALTVVVGASFWTGLGFLVARLWK